MDGPVHDIMKDVHVLFNLFPRSLHAHHADPTSVRGGKGKIAERDKSVRMDIARGSDKKIRFFYDRDPERADKFLKRPHQEFRRGFVENRRRRRIGFKESVAFAPSLPRGEAGG